MHYGSSFVDLIVWNVVVQTKLKMDISKESYRILKYKIYEKNVCMWRVLFLMQTLMGHRRAAAGHAKGRALRREAFFLFLYFSKLFFTEIYFRFHNLQVYTPTAQQGGGRGPTARLRGGRHPTAPLPGGRGLYVIKIYFLSHGGPYRLAGGRQAPHPNIKAEGPPTHLHS